MYTLGHSAANQVPKREALTQERQVLKLGGVLAVLGGLGHFIILLVHGDLPDQTTEIALEHIAGRAEWPALKLALIASVLLWVGAFVALSSSLSHGLSWLLSRQAVAGVVIGASVLIVHYSIMGYAMNNVADAWQAATGSEQADMVLLAEALLGVTGGLFLSVISWLYGLPYLLMGLAIALGHGYPRWLGWAAAAAGAGALMTGTTMFLGVNLVPFPLLYGGFVIPLTIWLAVMGLLMWRRAQRIKAVW
jgi:hypothetical protein